MRQAARITWRALLGCLAGLVLLAGPALADRAEEIDRLIAALRFEETIEIMRDEGQRYGGEVGQEMLAEAELARWDAIVAQVYDPVTMQAKVTEGFAAALDGVDLAPLLAFFEGPGHEIVALELAARKSLLDPEIEAATEKLYDQMVRDGDVLVERVDVFIDDSDLIERNVTGALNANLVFYTGLADGGALDLPQDEMLADIWAQEEDMRKQTETWLRSFLVMAYQPLARSKLEAYIALYKSPVGRDLNRAFFAAYDGMYEDLSYKLGLAVALQMQGEDL
ncbi:hypothetical protein ROG8370_00561 [Roseovarius gaetbuli]|uniref:DUF2059 domain-containing protein n=1 Tax=Roseovarius gaetbuli TaxID=1356575 RepID=A0A1X6YE95_9RHOB|nr:hypothetical protein [Roseovarius gaetbuli]SLN18083.1 hypothetical protein ROG8370_00561 [Roseovarius gaetbuli]